MSSSCELCLVQRVLSAIAHALRFLCLPLQTTATCQYRFSVGGFAPGAPVQPVLLDYSANTRFNPGWGLDESTPWHMWRLLTQLRTYIRLEILPVRSDLCSGFSSWVVVTYLLSASRRTRRCADSPGQLLAQCQSLR